MSDEELRETYAMYFRELGSTPEATAKTVSRLFPKGEEQLEGLRRLLQMRNQTELVLGDPWRVAVQAAMERLEREDAEEAMKSAWEKVAASVVERMDPRDWSPSEVERLVHWTSDSPWFVAHFDASGALIRWMAVPQREVFGPRGMEKDWFNDVSMEIGRGTTLERAIRPAVEQTLSFIRVRNQRKLGTLAGREVPLYPHEFVAGLLPRWTEYVVRWALPDERARAATEAVFALPGAQDLQKEIEEVHAVMRVPDFLWLESLLRHLVEHGLISPRMLGDDLIQVATEFWDKKRGRWTSVSEVVAAFDEIEGPRR